MPSDIPYDAVAAPIPLERLITNAVAPLGENPYRGRFDDQEKMMAKPSDAVTWTQMISLMSIALLLGAAVIGGTFSSLHSELTELRTMVHSDLGNLTSQIAGVREQAATTNGKLDLLIQETQRNGGRRP